MRNITCGFVAGLTAAWLASDARAEVRVSRTGSELRIDNGVVSLAVSSDGRSLRSFRYGAQELVEYPAEAFSLYLAFYPLHRVEDVDICDLPAYLRLQRFVDFMDGE